MVRILPHLETNPDLPPPADTSLSLPGLNSFYGMSVANTSVTTSNFSDGNNFHTTVTIPNASPLSFDIVCPGSLSLFPLPSCCHMAAC